jgi:hypothetical protein
MAYHKPESPRISPTSSGNVMAFSFDGNSPSISSSSTSGSLNVTPQAENSNAGVSTSNALTPEQQRDLVRAAWAGKFPSKNSK